MCEVNKDLHEEKIQPRVFYLLSCRLHKVIDQIKVDSYKRASVG